MDRTIGSPSCVPEGSQQAEGQSLNGQSLTLTPMWLQESGGRKLSVDFSEEKQSCTVQLPEEDSGMTYEVNAPIQVSGEEMTLGEFYLSPISVAFSCKVRGAIPGCGDRQR